MAANERPLYIVGGVAFRKRTAAAREAYHLAVEMQSEVEMLARFVDPVTGAKSWKKYHFVPTRGDVRPEEVRT